ncbi:tripartite tricarboxylate transporter substrate-binding protein [Pseudonocardia nematodicida]|uniref:Tripartite tricarboxylate transporter substrate-binding protein n=1 Tax=Pseudonocardia nematodicida TaxID=1206997 RepID=A0ABV1K5T3_9PSEU
MRLRTTLAGVLTSLAVLAASGCGAAPATLPADEFYRDRTIEFVVPYEPGGGYDLYVRDIAPYLASCTGGQVKVVNEAGAGGLLATSNTAAAAPDGTRVQIVNTVGAVTAQMGGADGINFRLEDLSWVARISDEANVVVVAADGRFDSVDAMRDSVDPVRFVSTGPGSNDYVNPPLLQQIFDFPVEVISGFAGSGEARTAYLRGDADAQVLPVASTIGGIRSGELRPVLVIGDSESPQLHDVPRARDLPVAGTDQRETLSSLLDLVALSRTVAAPPDLPPDRLDFLREAFACALENPDLVAASAEQRRPIGFMPGAELAGAVREVLNADPAFQQIVRDIT